MPQQLNIHQKYYFLVQFQYKKSILYIKVFQLFSISTYFNTFYQKSMYTLTILFKTATLEESFNFPRTDITKEIVEQLIKNLTDRPIEQFQIEYDDSENDKIILSTQEDYQIAKGQFSKEMSFTVYASTSKVVKFSFIDEYKHTPKQDAYDIEVSQQMKRQLDIKANQLPPKILNQQVYIVKEKKAKKEKYRQNNRKQHAKKQKALNQVEKIKNDMALKKQACISEKLQQQKDFCSMKKFDDQVKEITVADKIQQYFQILNESLTQNKSYKLMQFVQQKILSQTGSYHQNDKEHSGKNISQDKIFENLKETIIEEILMRLPNYLKRQCFKDQTQIKNIIPKNPLLCCKCNKTLNSKQKKKLNKQLFSEISKKSQKSNRNTILQQQYKAIEDIK